MTRSGLLVFTLTLLASSTLPGQEAAPGPEVTRVYELLQQHLPGVNRRELDAAAVKGIVSALAPKVLLVAKGATSTNSLARHITKASLFDEATAYVRVAQVSEGLAKALRETLSQLTATQKVTGLAVDLRYAGGEDYAAAAETADLFLGTERPLLDSGEGVMKSHAKTNPITVPVAVLINGQTTGAAEALAAALRETSTGLLLGNRTAGHAMVARDFPLPGGDILRVAAGRVRVGEGTTLGPQGVAPDISVAVAPADEQQFYADPFRVVSTNRPGGGGGLAAGTNAVRRPPRNEAELVRERRDGPNWDEEPSRARRIEPERPAVSDPVLARALDLLKGLAVVRRQG